LFNAGPQTLLGNDCPFRTMEASPLSPLTLIMPEELAILGLIPFHEIFDTNSLPCPSYLFGCQMYQVCSETV